MKNYVIVFNGIDVYVCTLGEYNAASNELGVWADFDSKIEAEMSLQLMEKSK